MSRPLLDWIAISIASVSLAVPAVAAETIRIETAKGTEPEKSRNAILAICGWKGVEGTYCSDKNGDGLHGYNVVRNEGGRVTYIKHIDFKD